MLYLNDADRERERFVMVAGIHKSLEQGHVYSYEDLHEKFGLIGEALEHMIDQLMERGHLRAMYCGQTSHNGVLECQSVLNDKNLNWQAVLV